MIRRKKERIADAENNAPASERDLEAVRNSARRLWREVRERGNDAVNPQDDLSARFDHDNDRAYIAYITRRLSPTRWATTAIGYDSKGEWQIENTHYGPGLETEPHGNIVGHATTYPLAVDRSRFMVTTSYKMSNDQLIVQDVGQVIELEPISVGLANALNEELRELANDAAMRRTLGAMAAVVDAEFTGG